MGQVVEDPRLAAAVGDLRVLELLGQTVHAAVSQALARFLPVDQGQALWDFVGSSLGIGAAWTAVVDEELAQSPGYLTGIAMASTAAASTEWRIELEGRDLYSKPIDHVLTPSVAELLVVRVPIGWAGGVVRVRALARDTVAAPDVQMRLAGYYALRDGAELYRRGFHR